MSKARIDEGEATWRAFFRLGFGVFVGEALVVAVYLASSPGGPHRAILITLGAAAVIAGTLNLFLVPRLARQPWRRGYSLTWTLVTGLLLAVSVYLDGGLSSPLLALILLPLMYGALIFGPFDVGVCVVASVIEIITLSVFDGGTDERPGTLTLTLAATAGIGLVVWLADRHRAGLEARALELTHDLEVLARTDGLTGCLNHRAFFERLDEEIERSIRYGQPLSLVVADIDHFKGVNDARGHTGGDDALRRVGAGLRGGSRRPDVVGRIGGDEFAVALPATTLDDAITHASRLVDPSGDRFGPVTLSAGVATLDPNEPTADRLFRDADRALYHAKDTGRAGVGVLPLLGLPARVDSVDPPVDQSSARTA